MTVILNFSVTIPLYITQVAGGGVYHLIYLAQEQESFLSRLLPTLVATLGGALFVFMLSLIDKSIRKRRSANYAIMMLVQHTNEIINLEKLISEWRIPEDRERGWLEMKSLIDFSETLPLHAEDLSWVLGTKFRNLVGEYIAARNGYLSVNGLVKTRNEQRPAITSVIKNYMKANSIKNVKSTVPAEVIDELFFPGDVIEFNDIFNGLLETSQAVLVHNVALIYKMHRAFKNYFWFGKFIRLEKFGTILALHGLAFRWKLLLPKEYADSFPPGSEIPKRELNFPILPFTFSNIPLFRNPPQVAASQWVIQISS
jgi:hypothetical protein